MYLSETDVERIARRVAELLRGEPELMNSRQCAAWLGITPSALRTRVSEGGLPHHKRGGRLYFDRKELTRYLLDESGDENKAVCRMRAEKHDGETAISDVTGPAGLRRVGRPILRR